jgi:hypothetical protein
VRHRVLRGEVKNLFMEWDHESLRWGRDIRFDEFELVAGDIRDGWTVLRGFVYCGVKRFFGMEEVCEEEGHLDVLEVVLGRRNNSKFKRWKLQYPYDASLGCSAKY